MTDINIDTNIVSPTNYTEKEKYLLRLLTEYDETGQLPKMLIGIVRVLNDTENPIRYAQAANTIRGMADKLLDRDKTHLASSYLQENDLIELEKQFNKVLHNCLCKIKDDQEQKITKDRADDQFKKLKNVLRYGAKTKIMQLLELVGSKNEINIIPHNLQSAATNLVKLYKYFTEVLHSNSNNEPEFEEKWLLFQDFLILVTSSFFEIAKELDKYLEREII